MAKSPQKTLVTFLLDRSSSMSSIHKETVSAFNEYLDELKRAKTGIDFTFIQFDTYGSGLSMERVCVCEPVKKVPNLTMQSFQPRGSTPLIDAAFKTIKAIENQEAAKNSKIVVCIQTDGEENSSTSHNWEELKTLISEKTKAGWQFNFMGAGIDSYNQGSKMGISVANTVSYGKDMASTQAAFRAAGMNTQSYASGMSQNTSFLASQKVAAGDIFQPGLSIKPMTGLLTASFNLNEKPKGNEDFSL